jgi:Ca2+-transporting ATPase
MKANPYPYKGLTEDEVVLSRQTFGSNIIDVYERGWIQILKETASDPMLILLSAVSLIYFLSSQLTEAFFMIVALIIVVSISIFQERRSSKALSALKKISAPKTKVIRDNTVTYINNAEVVVGDYLVAEEGTIMAADGKIVYLHDFAVNESLLSGEAMAVAKSLDENNGMVYQGTMVISGMAIYASTQVGVKTKMGEIGLSLKEIIGEKSPLELQIHGFVARMTVIGLIAFVAIWIVSYLRTASLLGSLLKGLTLAMSIFPEEIPVAFSAFMALGAWRLIQRGILAKDVRTVEALGAASVICLDKTGTITQNSMELKEVYCYADDQVFHKGEYTTPAALKLMEYAMWSSEPVPFDPMEKELHNEYQKGGAVDKRKQYHMYKEYPLAGKPPIMTHVFADGTGSKIIAAKGGAENLLSRCALPPVAIDKINDILTNMSQKGYRILAVAEGILPQGELPEQQNDFNFNFLGLVAFFDPPKPMIGKVFNEFYRAGIKVKIITGDNAITTTAIANQAGLIGAASAIDGEKLLALNDAELKQTIDRTNVFTRMFPQSKLKVIEALKSMGNIVAMTGDGVNDALALKAANIGISMGERGTEIARETASLVLLDDDLSKMTEAIAMGRQIYINLKKAISYIIAIHIPIILIVTIPLLLNWQYPYLFSPVHVIFFELVMGPTCSIVYENEPLEKGIMNIPPRRIATNLLTFRELGSALIQGAAIAVGLITIYKIGLSLHYSEDTLRTLLFITLISSNELLTLVNRSLSMSFSSIFRVKNNLLVFILAITTLLVVLIISIPFLRGIFHFSVPTFSQVTMAVGIGFASVLLSYAVRKRAISQP